MVESWSLTPGFFYALGENRKAPAMKLLLLMGCFLLALLGLFFLIRSQGWLGLNDWRLEAILALILVGYPAGMAARHM